MLESDRSWRWCMQFNKSAALSEIGLMFMAERNMVLEV